MAMVDLEFILCEEERTIRDTVHKFTEEVLRPPGIRLDALAEPAAVIAPDSILWNVFEKYRELGIGDRGAERDLTPAQRDRLRCIITEELGWDDSELVVNRSVSSFPRVMAQVSGKRSSR